MVRSDATEMEDFVDEASLDVDEVDMMLHEHPRYYRRHRSGWYAICCILVLGAIVGSIFGVISKQGVNVTSIFANHEDPTNAVIVDVTMECTIRQRVVQSKERAAGDDIVERSYMCETEEEGMYRVTLDDATINKEGGHLKEGEVKITMTHVNVTLSEIVASDKTETQVFTQNNRRGLAAGSTAGSHAMGDKKMLIVRATAINDAPTLTASDLSDNFFGTHGDPVNVASIYKGCSFDQMEISPGSGSHITGGVVEVHLPHHINGMDTVAVENLVMEATMKKLGGSKKLGDRFDFVGFCLPNGLVEKESDMEQWGAVGYTKHWKSLFNNEWCSYASAQAHTIGINMNMESSLEDGEYGDQSGLMGYSYKYDDIPLMCFNGAKNWFLGWYLDRQIEVDPITGFVGTLASFTDYDKTTDDMFVVMKLGNHYIQYNRAESINEDTQAKINEVAIVLAPDLTGTSKAVAGLSEGNPKTTIQDYDGNGNSATIEFCFAGVRRGSIDAVQISVYQGSTSSCGTLDDWTDTEGNGGDGSCDGDNDKYKVAGHYTCADIKKHVDKDELSSFCTDSTFQSNCCGTCASVENVTPREPNETPEKSATCVDEPDFTFGKGHQCSEIYEDNEMALFCRHTATVLDKCCAACSETMDDHCTGDDLDYKIAGHYSCADINQHTDQQELADLCSDEDFASRCCATCGQVDHVPASSPTEGGGQPLPSGCDDDDDFSFATKTCNELQTMDEISLLCEHVDDVADKCCASCHYSTPPGSTCEADDPEYVLAGHYNCQDVVAHVSKEELVDFCDDREFSKRCCKSCGGVSHLSPPPPDNEKPFNPINNVCENDPDFTFGGKTCSELSKVDENEVHMVCDKIDTVATSCCAMCKETDESKKAKCEDDESFLLAGEYKCEDIQAKTSSQELADLCTDRVFAKGCCSTCDGVTTSPSKEGTCEKDDSGFFFGGKTCKQLQDETDLHLLCTHIDDVSEKCCESCREVDGTPTGCSEDDPEYMIAGEFTCEEIPDYADNVELATLCSEGTITADKCCKTCASVSHINIPDDNGPPEPPVPPPAGCIDNDAYDFGGRSCDDLASTGDMEFACKVDDINENCCATCHSSTPPNVECSRDNSNYLIAGHYTCADIAAHVEKEELAGFCDDRTFRKNCCAACKAVEEIPVTPPEHPGYNEQNGKCQDEKDFLFGGKECSALINSETLEICKHVEDVATNCCATCKGHVDTSEKCSLDDDDYTIAGHSCVDIKQHVSDQELADLCSVDHEFSSSCCAACDSVDGISPTPVETCEDASGPALDSKSCDELADSGDMGVLCNTFDTLRESCCASCLDTHGTAQGCVEDDKGFKAFDMYSCEEIDEYADNQELANVCSHEDVAEGCCKTCAAVSHIEPEDTSGPAPTCGGDDRSFKFGGKTCSQLKKKADPFALMCTHIPSIMEGCCSSCRDAQGWGSCGDNPLFKIANHYTCDDVSRHVDDDELANFCMDDDFSDNCCGTCEEVEDIEPEPQAPAHTCVDSGKYEFDGKSCTDLAKLDEIHLLCEKVDEVGEYCCSTCRDAVSDAQYCEADDPDFLYALEYSCDEIKDCGSVQEIRDLCEDHEVQHGCCKMCEAVAHIEPSEGPVEIPSEPAECSGEVSGKSCSSLIDQKGHFAHLCQKVQAVAENCCSECADTLKEQEHCSTDNDDYRIAEHYSCGDVRKHVEGEELADFCTVREFASNCCSTCKTVAGISPPENNGPFTHDDCQDTEGFTFGNDHTCTELTANGETAICNHVPEVSENCCASCRDASEYLEGCAGDDPTFRLADHYSCDAIDAETDNAELSGLCEANSDFKAACCQTCGSVNGINQVEVTDYSELAGTCKDDPGFTFGTRTCKELAVTEHMSDLCNHVDDIARNCCSSCDAVDEVPGDFCTLNPDYKREGRTCDEIRTLSDTLMATFCRRDPEVAENCCSICTAVGALGTNFNEDVEPIDVVVEGDIDDSDIDDDEIDEKVATGTVTMESCEQDEIHFALELMTDNFPVDTYWTLSDYEETMRRTSPEYTEKASWSEYSVCLDDSKHYVFEIEDGSWDGICCGQNGDGYYTIKVDGEVVNSGGEFTRDAQVLITPPCKKKNEVRIVMDLTTDYFGSEVSFLLTGHGKSGKFTDDLSSFERRVVSTCVKRACYDLTVKDSGNNGLCCEYGRGGYTVVYDDKVFADSAFEKGSSETTTFGEDCPAGSEGLSVEEADIDDEKELDSANAYLNFLEEHQELEKSKAESP